MSGKKNCYNDDHGTTTCVFIFDLYDEYKKIAGTPEEGNPQPITVKYESVRKHMEQVFNRIVNAAVNSLSLVVAKAAKPHLEAVQVKYAVITEEIQNSDMSDEDKAKVLEILCEKFQQVIENALDYLNTYYYRGTRNFLFTAKLDDWR